MVLEEMIIIRGPIDGPEIARAFREAGMPTRITQTVTLDGRVAAKGTIGDIRALLKGEIARIEKLRKEFLADEEGEEFDAPEDEEGADDQEDKEGADDREDEEDADDWEDEYFDTGHLYDPYLDMTECIAEDIARFMEKYRPGDVISMADLKEWMAPLADVAPGEERSDALAKSILYKMTALSMLDKNGLIEIVGETVTVKGHMDPEDVIITIPGEAAEEIIPETLKEHNVTMAVTVTPVPEHLLIFGPEAIIDGDLDTIDEIIDDLGIDEEEYISFRAGVSMKRAVIARTLEILEERGTLTPEEALETLNGTPLEGTEEAYSISLELTSEFVKGLLNDLKKVGLVRKKGEKFRAI